MTVLVARNLIKLAADASSVNNYYVGHKITVFRTNAQGKKINQTKEIIAYSGAERTATIDGLWEADFVPGPGDTYEITPLYTDGRVSINPAIQTLDYVSSKTYGRGLDPINDLKLDSWLDSARKCDKRADIYVEILGAKPSLGDIYTVGNAGIWQGTVIEITGNYVRFTDIIGKLAYKWNDWRNFPTGTIVYHENRAYNVATGGIKATAPTHTSGSINGLEFLSSKALIKTSGNGPASIFPSIDGNPVRFRKNNIPASGYTLYDSDGVDYFRYIGWDADDQRFVTRHQTNISIDTSLPLFDNTNSLLQHFGGILRYTGKQYALEVEQMEADIDAIDDEPRNITADHIIGKINISDEGIRNSFNSLTVAYADPSNKFESRNISFFNSDYLKADRNVPKKGSLTIPGITNYYNARLLADKYLTRSRFGLNINMNLTPRGTLLLAGKVIQLQYPRYGWTNKKFRIENLVHNDDCTVDISATEYDPSFYTISNVKKQAATGIGDSPNKTAIPSPSNLIASSDVSNTEGIQGIMLSWTNAQNMTPGKVWTEVHRGNSDKYEVLVTSISAGNVLHTSAPHGLDVGESVKPYRNETIGTDLYLIGDKKYYVRSVPSATSFTISESAEGPALVLPVASGLTIFLNTTTLISEVPLPESTYFDPYVGDETGRIEKFYWIRYRVVE